MPCGIHTAGTRRWRRCRALTSPPRACAQGNPEVEALNRVRSSLGALAASSQGFSMPQPHLERARLCELPDEQLDGKYRAARDALRGKVLVSRHRAAEAAVACVRRRRHDAGRLVSAGTVLELCLDRARWTL